MKEILKWLGIVLRMMGDKLQKHDFDNPVRVKWKVKWI